MKSAKISTSFFVILLVFPGIVVHADKEENFVMEDCSGNVFTGVEICRKNKDVFVNLSLRDYVSGDDFSSRKFHKKKIMRRIGQALMMMPLTMQVLSLPSTLAQIKEQLIKSIVMAKMSILMILYNALRNSMTSERVVMMPKPEYHDHYYYPQFEEEDDTKSSSWWGR